MVIAGFKTTELDGYINTKTPKPHICAYFNEYNDNERLSGGHPGGLAPIMECSGSFIANKKFPSNRPRDQGHNVDYLCGLILIRRSYESIIIQSYIYPR